MASWSSYGLIENKIQRYAPDLLITGSETLLPRIGKRLGVRCIRIDYQHFLDDIDVRTVPLSARLPLMISKFARRVLTPKVDEQVVSSFHPYPLRDFSNARTRRPYRRVGVLLRKELQMERSQEAHLLVRMADKNKHWLEELAKIRLPAKVYGLGAKERLGSLDFRNSAHTFAEDLLSCAGVITDVGNQLIGEALACGKPVLAIPDASDYHQRISALFLSKCDLTGAMVAPALTANLVSEFYSSSSPQLAQTSAVPIANDEVKSLIELQLNEPQYVFQSNQ